MRINDTIFFFATTCCIKLKQRVNATFNLAEPRILCCYFVDVGKRIHTMTILYRYTLSTQQQNV